MSSLSDRSRVAYADCRHLAFERPADGVLVVRLDRPDTHNAVNERLHFELAGIWPTIGDDPQTRVVVVTGSGRAFSAGAELNLVEAHATRPPSRATARRQVSDLVHAMIELDKPVVSAITGVAIGAGLAVALLADISVAATNARLSDGHSRVGLAAGDHAVLIWPLLCGMAKAKYYLLTSEFVSGREAERIGLVSLAVPPADVGPKALAVAERLASGSATAIGFTKRSLNGWLRQALPLFEEGLDLQMSSFDHPDVHEGLAAIREGRSPRFPSAGG